MEPLVVKRLGKSKFLLIDGVNRFICIPGNTVNCIIQGERGTYQIKKSNIVLPKK